MTLLAAVMLVAFSGCDSGMDFLNGAEETEKVAISTDIFIPMEKVRTLNPIISKDEDTYYIDKLIYEGLFTLDGSLQAQPLLAQSYSYEDDGYSIRIRLKPGVKWHDGQSLSAADVKFSIDSYLNVLYSNLSIYNGYVDNIRSARVRDEETIQIYFKNNKDVALEKLTFPILPKHKFKSVSSVRNSKDKFVPVGTGPYKVDSADVNKEIVLSGNMGYHGGTMARNRIYFRVLPHRLDAVNLFEINDLTTSFSKNIDRDTLLNNKKVQMVSFPSNEVELIGFNAQRPALSGAFVRKALAYGVDVDKILETGYYNSGVRSDNVYYPGYMGADSDARLKSMDLEKAKALLKQGGYEDRDGNGFVEDEEGQEITIELLVNQEDASRVAAAQIIRDGLARLPIHVSIAQVDWADYSARLAAKKYDMYIGGYRIQDNFDLRFLLHSGWNNPAGYSNPDMDRLLDQMESAVTPQEKRDAFRDIKAILETDTPYYCLFYKTYGLIAADGLAGELKPYFFNPYSGCENWTVTYAAP